MIYLFTHLVRMWIPNW